MPHKTGLFVTAQYGINDVLEILTGVSIQLSVLFHQLRLVMIQLKFLDRLNLMGDRGVANNIIDGGFKKIGKLNQR